MKKFQFRLAKVLIQRNIVADIAQKEFAEAVTARDVIFDELQAMTNLKDKCLNDRAAMIQTSHTWVNSVEQINLFLSGQDLRIKNQNLRLQNAENLVESRRKILRESISEVKILEKLEEKQKEIHRIESGKAEQAEIDELTVIRFSRNENRIKGSHEDGI